MHVRRGQGGRRRGNGDGDAGTTGPTPGTTSSDTSGATIPYDTGSSGDDDDDDPTGDSEDTAPTGCPDDWWNPAWSTRVRVAITPDGRAADDIPLALSLDLTAPQLDGAAMGGADLRFIADDGTELAYELTRSQDQTAIAWIVLPRVDDDVDSVWIYLGNPDAVPADDPGAVWLDYEGVWHFDVAGGVLPSSASDIPGTPLGVTEASGPLGATMTFDDDDSIDFGEPSQHLFSGWPTMTVSILLYFDYPDDETWEDGTGHVLRRNGPVRFGRTWREDWLDDDVGLFQIDVENEHEPAYRRFQATRQAWHWFVYDYNGDSLRLYLDGEEYDDWPMTPGDLAIGEAPLRLGESDAFEGAADELWIGNATHSADWYGLQYSAMRNELFVLGAAEGC